MKIDFALLTVAFSERICLLLPYVLTTESRTKMGRDQSFMLILGRVGSGRVGLVTSLVSRVGSGQDSWTHVS